MKKRNLDILALYFAEGDAGNDPGNDPGTGPENGGTEPGKDGNDPGKKEPGKEPKTDPKDEKKYSDKDVDAMKVRWKKDAERKASEAAKLEKMNAEERMKYEYEQLKAELDDMKKAASRAEMARTVRNMLSEAGVNVPDTLSEALVRDDAEGTKTATDAFAKAFKEAVQQGVKDALNHKPPRASTTSGKKAATRQDWEKERDPAKRQAMLRDNPGLLD